tara:strand:+ start:1724 stop:2335 length:612 start_codon:yes stop_codon:yes gene_type:complete
MKSLSEIETTSKRASKAAGYSWGISEEVGKNIRILEMFGLPGIKNLTEYYSIKKENKFEYLKFVNKENKMKTYQFCPIISGISFLDQIQSLDKLQEIKFEKLAYPLLFLPFLSRGSEIIGKRLLLKLDNNQFILNFNISIFTDFIKNEIINITNLASVRFLENSDSFSEHEWSQLYKLSEETFVEENESLKKGAAGAGLTDND